MTRDLRLLPWRQPRIGIAQKLAGLAFEAADFGIDIDIVGAVRRFAKLGDAGLQLGDRLFKIEVGQHGSAGRKPKLLPRSTTAGRERMTGVDQLDQTRAVDMRVDL